MPVITDDMKNLLQTQKLGYVATVSPDNTPNVSPKGTIIPYDDEQLVFADIKSPQTMLNLEKNSSLEINVVNPLTRKGFRFKGTGTIHREGEVFSKMLDVYKEMGIKSKISGVVVVKLSEIREITSPLYDLGFSEQEILDKWKKQLLST